MKNVRCVDPVTNTIHNVVAIDFTDGRVFYKAYGLDNYWTKDATIMYSTGIHDNTKFEELSIDEQRFWLDSGNIPSEWIGREIFEGDIIQEVLTINYDSINVDIKRSKPFEVKRGHYVEGAWIAKAVDTNLFTVLGYTLGKNVKVIGNIYENADLLEVVE